MARSKPGLSGVASPECSDEANFIFLELQRMNWAFLTPHIIQSYLEDPGLIDEQEGWQDFVEDFHKAHEAYCKVGR